mgnify:CR=1 FL=1
MPFIPHTEQDVREMLATIGAPSIEALVLWLPQIMMSSILRKPLGSPSEMEGACFWINSALYR